MNYKLLTRNDMVIVPTNATFREIAFSFLEDPERIIFVSDADEKLYGYIRYQHFINNLLYGGSCISTNFMKLIQDENWKEDVEEYFKDEKNDFLPVVDENNNLLFCFVREYCKKTFYEEKWLKPEYPYLAETLETKGYLKIAIVNSGLFSKKVYEYLLHYSEKFHKINFLNGNEIAQEEYDVILESDVMLYKKRFQLTKYLFPEKTIKYRKLQLVFEQLELYQLLFRCLENQVDLYFIATQDETNVFNVTEEEKSRIELKKHWTYFLKRPKYKNVVQEMFGEYYSNEMLEECCKLPNPIDRNHIYYMGEHRGKYYNVINGNRVTVNLPADYTNAVYIAGPCIVFGPLVSDENTISSILQKEINVNHGGGGTSF